MSKLNLTAKLFLIITGARIEKEKKYTIKAVRHNVVYIFDSYEDFKNYFLKYLSKVSENVINLAIYKKFPKGTIVAFKGICDHIITMEKLKINIKELSQKEIDDIHKKGKITQLEKVEELESFELCPLGDGVGSAAGRCDYFENNCHECLLEFVSHKVEHDPINFKLTNVQ